MTKQRIIKYALWGGAIGIVFFQLLAIYLVYLEEGRPNSTRWDLNALYDYYISTDHLVLSLFFGLIGCFFGVMTLIRKKIRKLKAQQYCEEWTMAHIAKVNMELGEIRPRETNLWRVHPSGAFDDLMAQTIAGYMNSGGGKFFLSRDIGAPVLYLEEVPKALALPDNEKLEDHLFSIISEQLGPEHLSLVRINRFAQKEFTVWQLAVRPAPAPAFVHRHQRSYFYTRLQGTVCELDICEAIDYMEKNWGFI